MNIKQQKKILIKAYHECIYQEKSLHKSIFYYKNKIIEIRRKLELTKEDYERKQKLEKNLRRYKRNTGEYYKKLIDLKKNIIKEIVKMDMRSKSPKKY